ncbi:hypothetical protein HKX48_004282 [Thoreauomyces humboldtii]|nr:hypothetical protein HKX48_004282 [Thoreauomyces humboldtii]
MAAALFGFGSKPATPTLEEGDVDPISATSAGTPGSPQEDETPLTESLEAEVGCETSCMHFMVKSKLGWIAWKEMEATLYSIFERGFGATRCEMKFSDSLEDFGFEVEVPNGEVEKFHKFFKGRALAQEIDMLHGIDPITTSRRDAKLTNCKKTMGSTLQESDVRSSIEVLLRRFQALEEVGVKRDKEVSAIDNSFTYLQQTMLKRFDDCNARFHSKMEDAVWKKMQTVEKEIRESVQEDLAVLNLSPMDRKTVIAAGGGEPVSPTKSTAEEQALRDQIVDADRKVSELTKERDDLKSRLDASDAKASTTDGELVRVRSELSVAATLAAQVTALTSDLAETRQQRDYLRDQLVRAETERDALKASGGVGRRESSNSIRTPVVAKAPSAVALADPVAEETLPETKEDSGTSTDSPAPLPTEPSTAKIQDATSLSEFVRDNPKPDQGQAGIEETTEDPDPWREES